MKRLEKKSVCCKSCKIETNTKLSQLDIFGYIVLDIYAPLLATVLVLSGSCKVLKTSLVDS